MDFIKNIANGYEIGSQMAEEHGRSKSKKRAKRRYSTSSFRFQKKVISQKIKGSSSTLQSRLKTKITKIIKETRENETNVKSEDKFPEGDSQKSRRLPMMPMTVQSKIVYSKKMVLPDFLIYKNSSREFLNTLNLIETDENDDTESTYPLVKSSTKQVFRKMLQYLVDHDFVSEKDANDYMDEIRIGVDNERDIVKETTRCVQTSKYVTLKEDEDDEIIGNSGDTPSKCPFNDSMKSAPLVLGFERDKAYDGDTKSLI